MTELEIRDSIPSTPPLDFLIPSNSAYSLKPGVDNNYFDLIFIQPEDIFSCAPHIYVVWCYRASNEGSLKVNVMLTQRSKGTGGLVSIDLSLPVS